MKKILVIFFVFFVLSLLYSEETRLKPYVLAGIEKGDINDAVTKVESLLTENGFEILGKYCPMKAKNRVVICATHELLKKSVNKLLDKSDLLAFAVVTRFALFKKDDNIKISYRNPLYWGNAYFRNDFPDVEKDYNVLNSKIVEMFKGLSEVKNQPYGSKKGETIKKLRKYRFGWFFPYFDDPLILAKNTKYDEVLKTIEENFSKKVADCEKVFKVTFPDKKLTLYGAAVFCKNCELFYIPYFDTKLSESHDASLPWAFLVSKDKVVMLHGKYLLALAYPDFGMFTMMKAKRIGKWIPGSFKKMIGVEEK